MSGCTCTHGEYRHGENGCFAKVSGPSSDDYYCDCSWVPLGVQRQILDMSRTRILATKTCTKHPRYQALRAPRAACEGCWRIWIAIHPHGPPINLTSLFKAAKAQPRRASSATGTRRGSTVRPRARRARSKAAARLP